MHDVYSMRCVCTNAHEFIRTVQLINRLADGKIAKCEENRENIASVYRVYGLLFSYHHIFIAHSLATANYIAIIRGGRARSQQ